MTLEAEHAGAIRAFDYLAALTFGSAAAVASWWLVPDALPGIVAMLMGMVVGVLTALPILAVLTLVLGGFELIMMSMQIGMIAGMGGPMISGGTALSVAGAGAGVGLVIQLLLHALDRSLHGETVEPAEGGS